MNHSSAQHQHPILTQDDPNKILPLELVQDVNRAYFLHLLATNPDRVLPPGKSLISVVTRERFWDKEQGTGDQSSKIQQRVTEVMHAAFWDATTERLSSPDPPEQNTCIRQLSNDIREAISSLLPPGHQLLHILTLPPAPSISPLHSFLGIMKDVFVALRQRCAPVRDSEIDAELQRLENPPPREIPTTSDAHDLYESQYHRKGMSVLAGFATQSLRAIITISDYMKADLQDIFFGSMTEAQLQVLVKREAKLRERGLVIKLWSSLSKNSEKQGEDIIREHWRNWCEEVEYNGGPLRCKWKSRVIKALSAPMAISCTPYNTTSRSNGNELPPQFFLSAPSLYRLQDFIQAIIAAAALHSLIRLTSPSLPPETPPAGNLVHIFMQRVWSLFHAELEIPIGSAQRNDEFLNIIHLADEVVRTRQLTVGALDEGEEQRLREAVKRMLHPHDPVFMLLQRRLMDALLKGILPRNINDGYPDRAAQIPERLKAGRSHQDGRNGKHLKLIIDDNEVAESQATTSLDGTGLVQRIKGFEDPVLVRAIDDVFMRLLRAVNWIGYVWGDLV